MATPPGVPRQPERREQPLPYDACDWSAAAGTTVALRGRIMTRFLVIVAAQLAAAEPRNVTPEWTEEPVVTVTSDDPRTRLELMDMTLFDFSLGWDPRPWGRSYRSSELCAPPCSARLSAVHVYRISGDGITPSPPFLLPRGATASVRARTGSSTAWALGIGSVLLGGAMLTASPFLIGNVDEPAVGYGSLIGAGVLVVGGVALAIHGLTHVVVFDEANRSTR